MNAWWINSIPYKLATVHTISILNMATSQAEDKNGSSLQAVRGDVKSTHRSGSCKNLVLTTTEMVAHLCSVVMNGNNTDYDNWERSEDTSPMLSAQESCKGPTGNLVSLSTTVAGKDIWQHSPEAEASKFYFTVEDLQAPTTFVNCINTFLG